MLPLIYHYKGYIHVVIRFATSYLSLQRLHLKKRNLRKMFTFDEWSINKLSKEAKGREVTKVVLMSSFWNQLVITLKVMTPLVHVLGLVDGERKTAIGYIYESMEKDMKIIMMSFNNDESKYNDVVTIIDNRWTCKLHLPFHVARDDNRSGRARIIPTRNPTCRKKFHLLPLIYSSSICLKIARGF